MKSIRIHRSFLLPISGIALLVLSGCIEYEIETTLNADGSGVRSERLTVEDADDSEFRVSPDKFKQLMHVTEVEGWRHSEEEEDGEDRHVFTRDIPVPKMSAWSALSGKVHISAAAADARSGVGYVSYGDVQFLNSVKVETEESPDGRLYRYREKFTWTNLIDAIIEYEIAYLESELERAYPDLGGELSCGVVGLIRGGIWVGVDQGLWDDEDEGDLQEAIDRMAERAAKLIQTRYPDADESSMKDLLREVILDEDRLDTFLNDNLPGSVLAGRSEIIFRLNMPGRVVDSNAHDREGETLTWTFSPSDASILPVEVFAESRVDS